ncbi:hypothetical protein NDU88_001484 [Pleurodeles waltl]|uniref:Uncharacterized protein n=1 Tax=Pleurodeles waltl TaxID=8319 RepID=A0AAV7SA12_PLEWA|nr:hypothetical protein NDU88_001484 [Pleurodeles waltl]
MGGRGYRPRWRTPDSTALGPYLLICMVLCTVLTALRPRYYFRNVKERGERVECAALIRRGSETLPRACQPALPWPALRLGAYS